MRRRPQVRQPLAFAACVLFVRFITPGFGQRFGVPALHGWQGQQPSHVPLSDLTQSGRVGLGAKGQGREESVHRGEAIARQEGPAEALQPL